MPKRMVVRCLVAGLVLALVGAAWAEEEEKPKPPPTWRELAAQEGMTSEDIDRLANQKVLIGVRAFSQIYSAYAQHEQLPAFVTSDTVLRAYNVLFEESLRRVEQARARKLPGILQSIWKGLVGQFPSPQLTDVDRAQAKAVCRAQITIGTALNLLGEPTVGAAIGVREVMERELELVEKGVGRRRPPWLEASEDPRDTIDYDRFRPRGFYVGTEQLERYFRATAWLQDVPFDPARGGDHRTIAVLQGAFGRDWDRWWEAPAEAWRCRRFVRGHAPFLGTSREPSIFDGERIWHPRRLSVGQHAREGRRRLHVLPRYETPDSVLFRRLFDARSHAAPPLRLPAGLDLVAALGSDAALGWRKVELGAKAEVPSAWPESGEGEGLFVRYLHLLRHLLDEPDPAAPALLGTESWSRKSANTVLGGWAQLRHVWALAAMDAQEYFGEVRAPAGWVEPEPEFFSELLQLAIKTEQELRLADAFDVEAGVLDEYDGYRWCVELIGRLDREGKLEKGFEGLRDILSVGDMQRWQRSVSSGLYGEAWNRAQRRTREAGGRDWAQASRHERAAAILRCEAELLQEYIDKFDVIRSKDPSWARHWADPLDLAKRWEALQVILARLAGMASKQLRRVPFSEEDQGLLRAYAEELAFPMLYDGNAFMQPPPDRPLVSSVFSGYPPTAKPRPDEQAAIVHAGVGMPVAIYVLWPHEGREVLCRGGVMPYREVVEPIRLTDEAWAERLDSDDAPKPPVWLQPITAPIRPRPNRK